MTPLKIEIALHYYYNGGADFRDMRVSEIKEGIDDLESNGLLQKTGFKNKENPRYAGTTKLAAYVNQLLKVNMPVLKWIYPSESPDVSCLAFGSLYIGGRSENVYFDTI